MRVQRRRTRDSILRERAGMCGLSFFTFLPLFSSQACCCGCPLPLPFRYPSPPPFFCMRVPRCGFHLRFRSNFLEYQIYACMHTYPSPSPTDPSHTYPRARRRTHTRVFSIMPHTIECRAYVSLSCIGSRSLCLVSLCAKDIMEGKSGVLVVSFACIFFF